MLHIAQRLRDFFTARAFRLKASRVGGGSFEQAVRQALGDPSEVTVDTNEDGLEYAIWRYKHALGQRTDFNISIVEGKWSCAWKAWYPQGHYPH